MFSVASGMRALTRATALIAMFCCAVLPLEAATPSEFYASLLRRGIAAYDAQRFPDAERSLKLAAFGFVENIDQYETAHVYLALTYDRMTERDRARDSARRVVAAQRIESRYMALALPQNVRTAFEALATRLLTAPEMQILRAPATASRTATTTPPPTTTRPQPAPQQTPAATTNRPPAQTTTPPATTNTNRPATTTPPATTTQPPSRTITPPQTTTTQPPTTTTPPRTTTTTPPVTPPRTAPQQPTPSRATTSTLSASEVASRMISAERALTAANLTEARRIYRELLNVSLERATLIRVAEGLYRARDFAGALAAFQRLGALQRGEEPYRYYVAVALYETGQYDRARRELAAALPFIEITPDVARYRAKIEGAL